MTNVRRDGLPGLSIAAPRTLDRQRQRQFAITASTVARRAAKELMAADRLAVIGALDLAPAGASRGRE
jgi:hypothetical protein